MVSFVQLTLLLLFIRRAFSTTLIAAHYKHGIILGADTRTSRGGYVANPYANKFCAVSPSICLARSGSAADTQALAEELTTELSELYILDNDLPTCDAWLTTGVCSRTMPQVSTASHMLASKCFARKDSISASLICAGWDAKDGLSIFSIPSGGSLFRQPKFALSGSGAGYIYGFCENTWREDMGRDECAAFVAQAVRHAIAHDCSSGGGVQLLCIEPPGIDGGMRVLYPPEDGSFPPAPIAQAGGN